MDNMCYMLLYVGNEFFSDIEPPPDEIAEKRDAAFCTSEYWLNL